MSELENESSAVYGDDGREHSSQPAAAEEAGEAAAGDAGAGGGGRRRRRRRKHRGGAAAAGAQSGAQGEAAPSEAGDGERADAAEAPPNGQASMAAPAQPSPQGSGQGAAQNAGQSAGGGKRKKRKRKGGGGGETAQQPGSAGQNPGAHRSRQQGGWKRRDEGPDGNREGARGGFGSEHFGDNFGNGGAGGRRRGKFGGGGRGGFVGPMDHSYRTTNGNVADRPSQGGQRMVNGNLRRYDDVEFAPIGVIRDDAPARVVCFIEELFLVTKMQETARKMGVKVQFAKADKETLAALTDAPEAERPSLIVFDLNNAGAKPLTTIPKLKTKLKRGTSIIGFLQQIQGDLKLKALEAGCDSVMPKAAFSQNLPNLLRRHGSAEEEELAEV